MRKALALAVILSVGFFGGPASAIAASKASTEAPQAETGKLVGVLKDSDGKPLIGSTVNVMDAAGKVVASVTTDANGLFSVANLSVGTYSIQAVSAAGQTLAGATGVTITAGVTTTITASVTGPGALAIATGSGSFLSALGPAGLAALIGGGIAGVVAFQQLRDDASPSR